MRIELYYNIVDDSNKLFELKVEEEDFHNMCMEDHIDLYYKNNNYIAREPIEIYKYREIIVKINQLSDYLNFIHENLEYPDVGAITEAIMVYSIILHKCSEDDIVIIKYMNL